jgi:thymidine kinase
MVNKNYSDETRGKLKFVTGTMFAGKSKELIEKMEECEKNAKKSFVLTYQNSKSGEKLVSSRAGSSIAADGYFSPDYISEIPKNIGVILVDEGQFLIKEQVYYLYSLAKNQGIEVIIYGLRTTFAGELFEGAKHIFLLADEIRILPHKCHCGNSAVMHKQLRKIDNNDILAEYKSLCLNCYHLNR